MEDTPTQHFKGHAAAACTTPSQAALHGAPHCCCTPFLLTTSSHEAPQSGGAVSLVAGGVTALLKWPGAGDCCNLSARACVRAVPPKGHSALGRGSGGCRSAHRPVTWSGVGFLTLLVAARQNAKHLRKSTIGWKHCLRDGSCPANQRSVGDLAVQDRCRRGLGPWNAQPGHRRYHSGYRSNGQYEETFSKRLDLQVPAAKRLCLQMGPN